MANEETAMSGMTPEQKVEYVMERSMDIIMGAGDARNLAQKAMNAIAEGKFDDARALVKEAESVQATAHNVQTDMIQGDIRGGDEKMGYHVIFAHAQDTLMTVQVEINMTKSMIALMQKLDSRLSALENAGEEKHG